MFLITDEKILLLRRKNTGYQDDNYSVIAGHLDGNETVTTAAVREAKEEAGIVVNPNDLNLIHVMHHKSNNERIAFFFVAKKWEGEPKNMEPDKCSDLSWFSMNCLPENMVPYVRAAIKSYYNSIFFSEFGWSK